MTDNVILYNLTLKRNYVVTSHANFHVRILLFKSCTYYLGTNIHFKIDHKTKCSQVYLNTFLTFVAR